jgi:hypothetical protein
MNKSEYQQQLARLQKRYGEKSYDADFTELLWKSIKDYPDGVFTRAVDALISEHFRPVGKAAIVDIMNAEARKMPQAQTSKIQFKACSGCDGYGLLYLIDENRGRWLHSCGSCFNGKAQRSDLAPQERDGLKRGLKKTHVGTSSESDRKARTPWPAAIEGLLMGFDDVRGVSPSGLKLLGIDQDEARFLYDCFKQKDFNNEWAQEIIERSNVRNVFRPGKGA